MKTTVLPSGDTRGWLNWVVGAAISRAVIAVAPALARSKASSLATHQLLSPSPLAAEATKPLPSGVQSYS